jgi:ABC-type Fe3+/spermidine/putrescine transport system ATPase subunit
MEQLIIEKTRSEEPIMTHPSCHWEANFVSRSNLVEGHGIARFAGNDLGEGRLTQSEGLKTTNGY